jgi:hypothetical protein
MIDNFNLFKNFIDEDLDSFLFGQIMVRKKDGSRFARSNNRIIKDLCFRNSESFDKQKEEIIEICKVLGARAYVNPNPRSFKGLAIDMAGICLDYIRNGGERACKGAFATACGRHGRGKYWIVDIDSKCEEEITRHRNLIKEHIVEEVPTLNGIHFITTGFDTREFRVYFPETDLHKQNPSLLYCPDF